MNPLVALDFETEFSRDLSVRIQGNHNYARGTKIFLVGIYAPDLELYYAGPLELAPWTVINGCDWVAHNVSFDSAVFYAARDFHHQIPAGIEPLSWNCSADLSTYLLLGRSLKAAVKHAFDSELAKTIRDKAKGKTWPDDFTLEDQEDFKKYCLEDAAWSWRLWRELSDQWPPEEREFARILRERCASGVTIDQEGLVAAKVRMLELRDQAEDQIPWASGDDAKVLSMKMVREYCVAQHIPPPASLAEKSEACAEWEAKYGDKYPIIAALRQYRKANMYLRKLESMTHRLMPNGRMAFELKYNGAAGTGRVSGAGGWNIQNLPRTEYGGINLRELLIAAPGKKLVIADYRQIEPVVTAWLTGNLSLLAALRQGYNLYEADAKTAGLWQGKPGTFKKTDPAAYQLQKVTTLGVAYGMGVDRFKAAAKAQLDLDLDRLRAQEIILAWHHRNPGVKRLWYKLDRDFNLSQARGENFSILLPSNRRLYYFDILAGGRFQAKQSRDGQYKYLWGGALFENVIQGVARDVLRDAVVRLEAAGIPVLFSAHDEIVAEVPLKFRAAKIKELMVTPPVWASDLPLSVEMLESPTYRK